MDERQLNAVFHGPEYALTNEEINGMLLGDGVKEAVGGQLTDENIARYIMDNPGQLHFRVALMSQKRLHIKTMRQAMKDIDFIMFGAEGTGDPEYPRIGMLYYESYGTVGTVNAKGKSVSKSVQKGIARYVYASGDCTRIKFSPFPWMYIWQSITCDNQFGFQEFLSYGKGKVLCNSAFQEFPQQRVMLVGADLKVLFDVSGVKIDVEQVWKGAGVGMYPVRTDELQSIVLESPMTKSSCAYRKSVKGALDELGHFVSCPAISLDVMRRGVDLTDRTLIYFETKNPLNNMRG